MNLNKRPLYSLSVGEFIELFESINRDNNMLSKQVDTVKMDIIYVQEAAELMSYTVSTVYTKVSRKEIPVLNHGRPLTFSRRILQEWIKKGRPTVNEMIADEFSNSQNKHL